MQELQRNYAAIEEEPCPGSSVGSPLTKAFHWGSVKDHLGSIGGVEASRIEIMLN